MSGKRQPPWMRGQAEDDYQSHYDGRGNKPRGGKNWDYWHGTWGSAKGQQAPQERYDAVQIPQERAPQQSGLSLFTGEADSSGTPTTMKEIQKYLSQAQRADTRLRKLKEEQDKKSKQWSAYEQQMKQKFAKQRKLFEADLQRIAKEASEAAEQGQLAAKKVKEVVTRGYAEPEVPMEAEDDEWDALINGDQDQQLQDGFLKIALRATARAEEQRLAPPLHTGRIPVGPARGAPATGMAAPTGLGPPPGLTAVAAHGLPSGCAEGTYTGNGPVDPYMASSSGAYQKLRNVTSPRVNPYETGNQVGADKKLETTGDGAATALEAKLAANRALQPFGIPPKDPGKQLSSLIADDDDELSQSNQAEDPGGNGAAG